MTQVLVGKMWSSTSADINNRVWNDPAYSAALQLSLIGEDKKISVYFQIENSVVSFSQKSMWLH